MKHLLWRLLKNSPFILGGIYCFFWALSKGAADGYLGVFGWALIGFAFFITAAIFVALPIAGYLGDLCSRLFMPDAEVIPPPLYYLTEKYVLEGRYHEAEEEYRKIIKYHPRELRAYLEWLRLRALYWPDQREMEKIYNGGKRALKSERDLNELEKYYHELLESKPFPSVA
ncbi:MAG: hypothetical protein ACFCUX_01030 [Candidatus Methylacidiphilales bacterium]